MLMTGVPGSGKTLMARALPGILPRLTLEEALEVTRIYSIADLNGDQSTAPVHLAEALQYRAKAAE